MDITYRELVSFQAQSPTTFVIEKYKEDTSVLAYYIVKTVLFDKYQDFILWCKRNNEHLFDFKNTVDNQRAFVEFIRQRYRSRGFLNDTKVMEDIYPLLKREALKKARNKKLDYLMENMRMSICEMG
jgi:2-keto-4-pentenoate hydratase/2-oxohepta-3-ene-1,7-dioic acid hydratase in catechol pathway